MTRTPSPRQARRPAARAALASPLPVPPRPIKRVERLEQRVLLAVFTVTTIADDGPGSLRQAIVAANAAAGADDVQFNIAGAGIHTIAPLSPLPAVTSPLNLNAATQPGFAGQPMIELNGSLARDPKAPGGAASGLVVNVGPTVVRGLAVNRFRSDGIVIGAGAAGSRVEACYVGTNAAGTEAAGNGGAGIRVAAGGVVIGGGGAERRNVISGNDVGVVFEPATVSASVVSGNFIGTNAAGTAALGNRTYGVRVSGGAVTVGGTDVAARNVVSGNGTSGIYGAPTAVKGNYIGTDILGTHALPNGVDTNAQYRDGFTLTGAAAVSGNLISGNRGNGLAVIGNRGSVIAGNYIGTDSSGRAALGNDGNGIDLTANDGATTIGAAGPVLIPPVIDPAGAGRNVISANGGHGIHATGGDGKIAYNYIGVSADGGLPLGNRGSGVYSTAFYLYLGGTGAGEGNVISANGGDGVTCVVRGTVLGNRIGTNAAGDDSTPGFGNGGNGVLLLGGAAVVNNSPTGGGTVSNNTIAFNAANGVMVQGSATVGAKAFISQNSIFSNGRLGIDLATPFEGVSELHPVILRALTDGQVTLVRYKGVGTVEFFASPQADPSGFGEGKTFLRAVVGDGTEQTVRLPAVTPGTFITATATVSNPPLVGGRRDTSEFSNAVAAQAGVVQPSGSVVGRYLFYNQSKFDGFLDGFGDELNADERAIDPSKRALLPGQAASFANVSSYTKGINGVMFDLKDMAPGTQAPHVEVRIGVRGAGPGDPVTWVAAPAPTTIARRNGAGAGGTDRVTLIWPNGAIKNQWLKVTVKADAVSWLPRDDVFYFGNLAGEIGDAASPLRVSAMDVAATRRMTRLFAGPVNIPNVYDINRDGTLAGSADVAAVKANLDRSLPALVAPDAAIPAPSAVAAAKRLEGVWAQLTL